MYKHHTSHAHNLYIYTPRFYSRGHVVNRGAKIIQREDDSKQKCRWTPTQVDCTKCNCCSNLSGHRWFELHENGENTNVLDMLTTGPFVHAQKSTTCAFHSLLKLLSIRLRNTLQSLTKQKNTEYVIDWVCANVPQVNVQRNVLTCCNKTKLVQN